MSQRTVWAVEIWDHGHWRTLRGGLTKASALKQAKSHKKRDVVNRYSIAEYPSREGSSSISRHED